MGFGTLLSHALKELENVSDELLRKDGAEEAGDTILVCSIAAAVSGIGSGMLPGVGSVVASAASVTAIWTMYVKINKHLGISVKDNILKSLASAILTNIISFAGSYLLVLIGATAINLIPGLNYASTVIYGTLAFISVYASGILYIKLLTRVMKAKKNLDSPDIDLKSIVKDTINDSDIKDILKEGEAVFKQAKKDGKFTNMQTSQATPLSLFEKEFKRYEATRDYHNAFLYCLVNLQSDIYCTIAMNKALALIENHSYLLFEKYKRVYRFVIDKKLDKNWLVDALINQGINDMGTASMSIGYTYVFNRINCYHFENLFSSCNIGMVQNSNSSIIYYDFSFLRNNHDIVKAVCKEIIKLYL